MTAVLPEDKLRTYVAAAKAFRSTKSTPQSEDKINDCGKLSHNTANDFQWSINTSMLLFPLGGKKRKGVEAKFGCL
jgi:hypothetical protein